MPNLDNLRDHRLYCNPSCKGPVPATEAKRSGVADRERTRKIVHGAVEVFLSAVLDTPGDKPLDVERLWAEAKPVVIEAAREYRARARQRFAEDAVATESLG
ncbi:MAG: hypothetical protein AAB375_01000 [Patescibacteria group bacterium]